MTLGQNKAGSFSPDLHSSVFKGHGNLALVQQFLTGSRTVSLEGDSVKLSNSIYNLTVKPTGIIPGVNEYGGIDYIIVLNKKPSSNKISFGFNSDVLQPYLQPALTAEWNVGKRLDGLRTVGSVTANEVRDDIGNLRFYRSDNVVNSIAWRHKTKGGMVTPDDVTNRITTGKGVHFYAMKLTAADGSWIMCPWILESGNLASVLLDQTFLNTKPYPMILAPIGDTFGYTSIGGSTEGLDYSGVITSCLFTGAAGTATSISWYTAVFGTPNVEYGLYAADDPSTLVDSSVELVAQTGTSWKAADLNSSQAVTASPYRICITPNAATVQVKYDTGDTNQGKYKTTAYGSWPSSVTWNNWSYNSNKHSAYVTYTAGGGAAYVPRIIFM